MNRPASPRCAVIGYLTKHSSQVDESFDIRRYNLSEYPRYEIHGNFDSQPMKTLNTNHTLETSYCFLIAH